MITRDTLQAIMHRPPSLEQVLSLFLDMSVTSDNKRTYRTFLQQKRNEHPELQGDTKQQREALLNALVRAEEWVEANFDHSSRGIALFVDVAGNWIEGHQFSTALQNRLAISARPVIGPLAELLARNRHYGIVLVDREHCRVLTHYMSELRPQKHLQPDAYPTSHDVKAGGEAAKDFQKHKAEETRQFFRMFSAEIDELDRRMRLDHWVLLGTDENVRNFEGYLTDAVRRRVIHTAHCAVDAPDPEIVERVAPFFAEHALHGEAAKLDLLRDRLRTRHFAISGVHDTLEQLQEGKVETLVIARDLHSHGAQCTKCSFFLDRQSGLCPYCGGELRNGVDLGESMIRMASEQQVLTQFVDAPPLHDLEGVGALLKF